MEKERGYKFRPGTTAWKTQPVGGLVVGETVTYIGGNGPATGDAMDTS